MSFSRTVLAATFLAVVAIFRVELATAQDGLDAPGAFDELSPYRDLDAPLPFDPNAIGPVVIEPNDTPPVPATRYIRITIPAQIVVGPGRIKVYNESGDVVEVVDLQAGEAYELSPEEEITIPLPYLALPIFSLLG